LDIGHPSNISPDGNYENPPSNYSGISGHSLSWEIIAMLWKSLKSLANWKMRKT
jgi:hypothetical protein